MADILIGMSDKPSPSAAYDATAAHYDMTRRADPMLTRQVADYLGVHANGHYLDIGCGTGNYTWALAQCGGTWCGLDPSGPMLAKAAAKPAAIEGSSYSPISWVKARAEAMPFGAARFDGLSCFLALHHMSDHDAAFAAMAHAMKREARLVIFTPTRAQAEACGMAAYFPNMIARDAAGLPELSAMDECARNAGLKYIMHEPFHITPATQDRFFYSGKYRPEIYLHEGMRANMSPFRMIEPAELAAGLAALAADIETGQAAARISAASRAAAAAGLVGDYMLCVYEKA